MSNWRCPHCGTPQAEASRCWSCGRSPFACSTCRRFRRAVSATLGYCTLGRSREVLTGDEVRPCWQSPEVAEEVPFLGLFGALNPAVPEVLPPALREHDLPAPTEPAPTPATAVAEAAAEPVPMLDPERVPARDHGDASPEPGRAEPWPAVRQATPSAGAAATRAPTLTGPVDEDSRAVWLAAGGEALLQEEPPAAQVAVVPRPPAVPWAPAPIVALVPPGIGPRQAHMLSAAHAPDPGAARATTVGPARPDAAAPGVPLASAALAPAATRPPLAPLAPAAGLAPEAGPASGSLAGPIAIPIRPAPDLASPAERVVPGDVPGPASADPLRPGSPDPSMGPDTRRTPGLTLLPATLANRFRRGMAGLGWREPAPPLFSSSARTGRPVPGPATVSASSSEPALAPAPTAPAAPAAHRFTPPPPPTAVPGRLVEAPWVPPRASALPLGEQLRRTELARRERPLPDVERLAGRGGGDAGA